MSTGCIQRTLSYPTAKPVYIQSIALRQAAYLSEGTCLAYWHPEIAKITLGLIDSQAKADPFSRDERLPFIRGHVALYAFSYIHHASTIGLFR